MHVVNIMFEIILWGILFALVWFGVYFAMKHWWTIVYFVAQIFITFIVWSFFRVWYLMNFEGGFNNMWDIRENFQTIMNKFNEL